MFNLTAAKKKIVELESQVSGHEEALSSAHTERDNALSRAEAAETERDDAITRAEAAEGSESNLQSQIIELTTQRDQLQSRVNGIEEEVKTKATSLANSHLAAIGHPPISDDSQGSEGGPSDAMTEDMFWSTYRSQPAESKNKWYEENKHHIGR